MKYTKFRKKYKDLYEDLKEQMEKDIYNALQTLGYRGEKNHKDMMKFARKYKINSGFMFNLLIKGDKNE